MAASEKENRNLALQVSKLQKELTQEREFRSKLDVDSRKQNLKILGIAEPDSGTESQADLITKIKNGIEPTIGKNIVIINAYRLGKKLAPTSAGATFTQQFPRPVMVSFGDMGSRHSVWTAKEDLEKGEIKIREDLPPDIELRRKKLIPSYVAARKKGLNCKLKLDKLVVNSETYTHQTLHRLPEGLRPMDLASKEFKNTLVFWGKEHPLSNFYLKPDMMWEDEMSFSSSEQFYQAAKATHFEDFEAREKIMSTHIPAVQKKIKVNNFDEDDWNDHKEEMMFNGLTAKFTNNPELGEYLLSTGNKELAEASPYDREWGTGISMKDPKCFDRDKWGRNLLGKLLMTVRKNLRDKSQT